MRSRRSTRTAGGSRGVCADGVSDNNDSSCQQAGEMDESIVLDTKSLLEMLGPSSPAAGEEELDDEEEDGEEEEKQDLVMDLDDRFKNADIKRKFSESMPVMSAGGTLDDDTSGSVGANSGDGGAIGRDSSDSSSSGSSGVVAGLPEAGANDNSVTVPGPLLLPLSLLLCVSVGSRNGWGCRFAKKVARSRLLWAGMLASTGTAALLLLVRIMLPESKIYIL